MMKWIAGAAALTVLSASAVSAQTIGTFRWQMRPLCNVVTVTITQKGGIYVLEGADDQCGAATVAAAQGIAQQNPDGSIGLGFTIIGSPGGQATHVSASISLASLGGTWRDSAGREGPFIFTPGAGIAGPARPDRLAQFRVVGSGGASIASSVIVPITNWTTVESDQGGGIYTPAAGTYAVPSTGIYAFNCHVTWNAFSQLGASPRSAVLLQVNGVTTEQDFDTPSTVNGFQGQQLSTVRQFTAGDAVRCSVYQSSGVAQNLQSPNVNMSFTVTQLR